MLAPEPKVTRKPGQAGMYASSYNVGFNKAAIEGFHKKTDPKIEHAVDYEDEPNVGFEANDQVSLNRIHRDQMTAGQ